MSPPTPSLERAAVALLFLVGLVAATHTQLLGFEFVYDDRWTVFYNAFTAHPANLWKLLDGRAVAEGVVDAERPVMLATVFLDRALFGLSPGGHHLQNVLWHLVATLLLGWLVLRTLGDRLLAWVSAFLFAVLPAHAEAVAVVSYREDLLAAAFVFAALAALQRRGSAWAAVPLVFLGFLSKESAGAALMLWPVLAWMRRERPQSAVKSPVATGWGLGLLAVGVALALGLRMVWAGGLTWAPAVAVRIPERGDAFATAGAVVRVATTQLGQLLLPVGLGPEHPDPPTAWPFPLEMLAVGALGAGLFAARRAGAGRVPVGAVLLALGGLAPLLAAWRLPNLWADRFLYLPSAGASLLLAHLVVRHGLTGRWRRTLVAGLAASLLLAHSVAEQRYHDEVVLWSRAIKTAPGSARAWLGLAAVKLQQNSLGEASAALERGRALSPDSAELLRLEAMLACRRLNRREAWSLFEQAAASSGPDAGHARPAWRQLQRAACALELRELDKAIDFARRAQQQGRWIADAHALEGLARQRQGDLSGAYLGLGHALEIDPDRQDLRRNLDRLFEESGGSLSETTTPPREPLIP